MGTQKLKQMRIMNTHAQDYFSDSKPKPKPTLPALFLKLQRDQMQQNLIKIQTLTRVKRQSPLKFQNFKRLEEYSKSVEAVMNSDKAKNVKEAELMRILLGIDGIDCSPLLRPLRKALATQINQELEALDNLAKEIPESAGDVNEVNVHTEE